MDCHDYYCHSHVSSHQNGDFYFSNTGCSICRTYIYGCLDITLPEVVYQKEWNSSRVSESYGNRKLPLSILTTLPLLRLTILTFMSLTSKSLLTSLTCSLMKNGQLVILLLLTTTHGTKTLRSHQMRKDPPSSLLRSPPDHNSTQLPEKQADLLKVITPCYPPLIPLGNVPGGAFMHQQPFGTSEENNLAHDLQTQGKTSIPPAPTATLR